MKPTRIGGQYFLYREVTGVIQAVLRRIYATEMNTGNYHGQPGDQLITDAADDFKVMAVQICRIGFYC